jgi:Fic family protein
MILNHKTALDYIVSTPPTKNQLTLNYILKVHTLLTARLNVSLSLRSRPVGITGSTYQPPKKLAIIKESLQQTTNMLNKLKDPLEKALVSVAMISYIQPFEDGNKRTARLIGNAILLSHNYYPISYRAVNEIDYKLALLYFYEQNTLLPFKKIFLEQYEYSLTHYFQT